MKNKKTQAALAVVCCVLGFALTLQLKSVHKNNSSLSLSGLRAEDLQIKLLEETEKNGNLTAENEQLKKDIKKLQNSIAENDEASEAFKNQLERLELSAGFSNVTGPGVVVTLNDSKLENNSGLNENYFIIHDDDILRVINELCASGAEAISINDERLVATSEIRCAGSTVSVNGNKYSTPFVIKAIGNSKTMESALNMRQGVVEVLTAWGIQIDVAPAEQITIPAYNGSKNFKYAVPVKEED